MRADWDEIPLKDQVGKPSRPHRGEAVHGFEYAHVWRRAAAGTAPEKLGPPEGEGWTLNRDIGDNNGQSELVPAWCKDGSIVMQITHWRRSKPGQWPYRVGSRVSEFIAWDGDPSPNS
jgi:hypothetical protein